MTVKLVTYAVAALFAAVAIWAAYTHVYNNGYDAAKLHYEAEIAKDKADRAEADANEQRRQMIANNAAKAREAAAIAALEAEEAKNSELRKELRREAKQDPDAGRIAVGSGSVQRINKVR